MYLLYTSHLPCTTLALFGFTHWWSPGGFGTDSVQVFLASMSVLIYTLWAHVVIHKALNQKVKSSLTL